MAEKKTQAPATVYHPYIEGATHFCDTAEELDAWKAAGWVVEEPDYTTTGATVEFIASDQPAKNK